MLLVSTFREFSKGRSEIELLMVSYEGHSLAMLNRIAAALNQRVEIRFVPAERRLRSA